ncbi:MAG: FtsW/RodA/SpoVE family cell cycle protein [Anaerolineales bacterium]
MSDVRTTWRHFDFWLLGAVAILSIFSVAMIRSAIAGNITLAGYDQRQAIFVIIGFGVILITTAIDYRFWESLNRLMYIIMAGLLGVLYIVGAAIFGSARWFETTYFDIQPSELAKIVIILVLAEFFSRNLGRVNDPRTIIRSLLLTGGIVLWIILQPNLGTSIVIMVIWFTLLWASGLSIKMLAAFAGVGIIIPLIGYPLLADYQKNRILDFLFPDPNARHGDIYNIQQALISIGSGGWFGKGYNLGTQVQLRFLKVRHSDFIFSAIAEEFGFVGTIIVVGLILFVIYRILRAARLARDTYGALICYGVATLVAIQAIINIGVNLRLIPATGLPLPFISYGGSAMLSLLLGIGLVQSVIVRHKSV